MGLAMHAIWSELLEKAFGFSRGGSTGRGAAAPAVSSQLGRTERNKNFYTPKQQQQTQSKGESTGMFLSVPPLL